MSDRCVKRKDNKNCFIGTKEFEIFHERLKNINESKADVYFYALQSLQFFF